LEELVTAFQLDRAASTDESDTRRNVRRRAMMMKDFSTAPKRSLGSRANLLADHWAVS
jgi:hypothetical protein